MKNKIILVMFDNCRVDKFSDQK